ncbi:zinc ribbon domain-containing protein [Mycolicibacterium sp. P1-18]|nr:zinc ribbon domain-containing protein [Mycolicibacterium sp. P1-18]
MAGYRYRCPADGFVEASFPIGTAPASVECDSCRGPARRVFSSPALTNRHAPGAKALDMHAMSQSSPGVVTRSTDGQANRSNRGTASPTSRLPRP